MRLVLYVRGFPPRETGGPAEVSLHLARGLVRDPGVQLTLVVQTDSSDEEIRAQLGQDHGLTLLRLPYYATPREALALRPVLRAMAAADVIHFNEFPFRHLPLVVLAKVRGIPTVFTLHGLLSHEIGTFLGPNYPLPLPNGGGSIRVPRSAISLLLSVYRSLSGSWSAVVVPSEALRRDATAQEGIPPARIRVIPHGTEVPRVQATAPAHRRGPIRILFVGKLEAVKGPDLLLEALERLQGFGIDAEAWFVGAGSLEASLRARAQGLGPTRVAFLGMRRGDELESLYADSDIVAVPSRYETLSLVVLEAMAAGRPILATDVGGIPEIAREPRNALLVRPDADAIADGLRRLIEQPALRASMSAANLADANGRAWPAVIERYEDLYASLIGARATGEGGPSSSVG